LNKDGENGGGAEQIKTPHLIISFDPRTYQVSIAGRTPNLEFGKYLLTTALETVERQMRERDTPQIVRPELAPDSSGFRSKGQ